MQVNTPIKEKEDGRTSLNDADRTNFAPFRRALNISWTINKNYGKGLKYDASKLVPSKEGPGSREFYYLNTINGLIDKDYDHDYIKKFLLSANPSTASHLKKLLNLIMVYRADKKIIDDWPALQSDRNIYLSEKKRLHNDRNIDLMSRLEYGLLDKMLGIVPKINPLLRALLDELLATEFTDSKELTDKVTKIYEKYFHSEEFKDFDLAANNDKEEKVDEDHFSDDRDLLSDQDLLDEMLTGSAEFTSSVYFTKRSLINDEGPKKKNKGLLKSEATRRKWLEKNYGQSILSPKEEKKLEAKTSYGTHRGMVPLIIEAGIPEKASNFRKKALADGRKRNESYLRSHRSELDFAIRLLSRRLLSIMKEERDEGDYLQRSGIFQADKAWRIPYLQDDKVFIKKDQNEISSLNVDLLLDSSASQYDRSGIIASQAYILARALAKADIPLRISSFQSQQGFTIIKKMRDYDDRGDADSVLDYFPDGANRDGYALRLINTLMRKSPDRQNILIFLSDGKPFDQRILLNAKSFKHVQQYKDDYAVNDTSTIVRQIRQEGTLVFGIFTGQEEDLWAAKKIFSSSFTYVKDLRRFAGLVSKILEDELKNPPLL